MWFWSVFWSTNCPVFFSFYLVDQKKIVQSQGIFGQSLGIFGQPNFFLVYQNFFGGTKFFFWSTKNSQRLTKNSLRLDNFFLVDQNKWEKDRTIGRPRDWPKPHGRDLWTNSQKLTLSLLSSISVWHYIAIEYIVDFRNSEFSEIFKQWKSNQKCTN